MKLADAKLLADKVIAVLEPFCERIEIAGSIRRGRAEVGDVDIVAMPKSLDLPGALGGTAHLTDSQVWAEKFTTVLWKKMAAILEERGQELIRCSIPCKDGLFQVDIYRARPETWGVILLVRTGSREHNVKLCSLARSKGLMLSAAQGVVSCGGTGGVVACRTEEEIFAALGLGFVEPKNREVPW